MRNVATAVIILSTLGAVLDMALTVTTSVYEVSIQQTGDETDRTCRKRNADRKRSNRDNSEYIAVCICGRIVIIIFLSEDAGLYTGNIIKFENIISKLCIYDIWCDCLCGGDVRLRRYWLAGICPGIIIN